jgi:hypothetical protein
MTDHLEWLSEMVFEDCYLNMNQYCVRGYYAQDGMSSHVGTYDDCNTNNVACCKEVVAMERRARTEQSGNRLGYRKVDGFLDRVLKCTFLEID